MERKHWMDNLRWATVLLVLFYHVIYFYNAKGVFGGIGGFYEVQPWDVIMSLLYPWFMMLLFLVAGISSRYALGPALRQDRGPSSSQESRVPELIEGTASNGLSHKEFIKSRTRKLLVPATIGLFVFQWMAGYFNTQVAAVATGSNPFGEMPDTVSQAVQGFIKYFAYSLSGIGPLWFVQDLWLFSLLLVLVRVIEKDKLYWTAARFFQQKSVASSVSIVLGGFLLVWAGAQGSISHPRPETADGLWNLYRPLAYFVPFLLGYFVFSHKTVQECVKRIRMPMLALALVSGGAFAVIMYGKNDTDPIVLKGWACNLFAWFAILVMLGCFKAWADKTSPFATYMTRSSYGIYVVHYLVIASLGYMMKMYTTLAPWMMYVLLFIAVMLLSPAIYEVIRRIPFVRWCVLGEKKR
ncbi:MAG: acyltransferase family protein [Bacteroidales bacterium]|nr:acyltransferase family protein [Bacteroidales bacterium]